ncbi:hypothetical protein AB0M20_16035 [Actinoplanes sp. NPDC051633]|uniref:hypothetical protein n=1 Tax=Actinoplanes sp. NPDC051633 TaxID=3155670 RepID=UPI003417C6DF
MDAMQTPDGVWRVETYVPQRGRTPWFRLIHVPTENAVEGLTIGSLQELLEAEGYGWGDLEPVPATGSDAERRGDKSA